MENTTIDQSDLARLNEKDKLELQTFITHETQKTRINAREFLSLLLPLRLCDTLSQGKGSISLSFHSSSCPRLGP